jgi:hypothetical protein
MKAPTKTEIKKTIAQEARRILEMRVTDSSEPKGQETKPLFQYVVERLLRGKESTQLATLQLLVEHGFGKPVVQVETKTETTQRYVAEVPPVSSDEQWMKAFGNPTVILDEKLDN